MYLRSYIIFYITININLSNDGVIGMPSTQAGHRIFFGSESKES